MKDTISVCTEQLSILLHSLTLCGPSSRPIVLVSISNAALDEPIEKYWYKLVISPLSIKINKQQLLELIEKITSKATTHNSKCDLLVLPWMPYWTH